jgi:hypothetical protein
VRRLEEIYRHSNIKHKLHHIKDYIAKPKASGYRGVHMIYEYNSDKVDTWNSLKVELQFRSPLQHRWATAVETVGAFTQQALKSSRGEAEWLRFFALMGSFIAQKEKSAVLVPNTPQEEQQLKSEIRDYVRQLNAFQQFDAFRTSISATSEPKMKGAKYYLLELNTKNPRLNIIGYKSSELQEATADTSEAEKNPDLNVVLVAVSSLAALPRAYPNYYADTEDFIRIVREAVSYR